MIKRLTDMGTPCFEMGCRINQKKQKKGGQENEKNQAGFIEGAHLRRHSLRNTALRQR